MSTLPRSRTLPLFPLNTVLFPGGWLPLQIFELRYLDMIQRAWREGTPFGVVALLEGREVQRPAADNSGERFANEQFHAIGTLAEVRQLERPQPGLLRVMCQGTQRFRLQRPQRAGNGLWTADVELLPADPVLEVPSDLEATVLSLRAVLDELQVAALQPAFVDDCAWVAHRWAELLPLAPSFKQQLLVTESPLLRLELVADVLDRLQQPGPDTPAA